MAKQETLTYIASLETSLAQLRTRKDEEDAAEAAFAAKAALTATSARVKGLAAALHTLLCTAVHGEDPTSCQWKSETLDYDDPAEANWTKDAHALWLNRAKAGVQTMRDLGFTVTDPA